MLDPHLLITPAVIVFIVGVLALAFWPRKALKPAPRAFEAPPVAQIQPPSWLTPAPEGKIWCLCDDGWKLVDIEPGPGVKEHGTKPKSQSKSPRRRKAKRAA
jgi:hypothetical protein